MQSKSKKIGVIGMGSMGGNIARQLSSSGYSLVVYDRSEDKYSGFTDLKEIEFATSVNDLVNKLIDKGSNTIIWSMLPAGTITNGLVADLSALMRKGDLVIDASNSYYTDSIANYSKLKEKGIYYLDVGCAGGPEDLKSGVALMVGGDRFAFEMADNVFKTVAGNGTYGYVGESGSGQKVKLVHNEIFYGIFPVYAEGVELLLKMKENDPSSNIDIKESLRLLAVSPPITTDIMSAMEKSIDELPKTAPEVKVSDVVRWGSDQANKLGVEFSVTKTILDGYKSMSERSRAIYTAAKRIITGH